MASAASLDLELSVKSEQRLRKLIDHSHEQPMNFADCIDWHLGIDRQLPPKNPKHSWIFGTPFHDELSEEQRHEVLWLETARDVSMFISLEQTLPVLYVGYLNRYEGRFAPDIYEYLMIFSKEEIVHTLVFKEYMKRAGLPLFPGEGSAAVFLGELPNRPPVQGILYTLLIEWLAELGAMFSSQSALVDPLTRQLFHRHHIDEARHIAFARDIVEAHFACAPEAELVKLRELGRTHVERLVPYYTYNRHIARLTSFDFPVRSEDDIAAVANSEANAALNEKRFAPMFAWMRNLGMW